MALDGNLAREPVTRGARAHARLPGPDRQRAPRPRGQRVTARLEVVDPEGDALRADWVLRTEVTRAASAGNPSARHRSLPCGRRVRARCPEPRRSPSMRRPDPASTGCTSRCVMVGAGRPPRTSRFSSRLPEGRAPDAAVRDCITFRAEPSRYRSAADGGPRNVPFPPPRRSPHQWIPDEPFDPRDSSGFPRAAELSPVRARLVEGRGAGRADRPSARPPLAVTPASAQQESDCEAMGDTLAAARGAYEAGVPVRAAGGLRSGGGGGWGVPSYRIGESRRSAG